MSTTTDGKGQNDNRFDDLLAKCAELGAAHGKGKNTLAQFYMLTANAAYDCVIDLIKDKHGDGIDDAAQAYEAFDKARNASTMFDHKSPSGKVQTAKLRAMVKLGGWTRAGAGEPIATMNKLVAMRDNLRKTPGEVGKLDDICNTLLRYARFQVKQLSLVDDKQVLRSFCMAPAKQSKTLEDFLNDTAKRLEDLRQGKAGSGTLQHSSPRLVHALIEIREEAKALRKGEIEPGTPDGLDEEDV